MKIIFGLGNPGKKYERTRHNIGFMFVEEIREYLGWDKFYEVGEWDFDKYLNAEICKARSGGEDRVIFVKPQTFMNRSGNTARQLLSRFDFDLDQDFVLVHDDLDIDFGEYKIQRGVSPKDHRGVIDVEEKLMNKNFLRVRIGGDSRSEDNRIPGDSYVVMKMSEEESQTVNEVISDSIKSLRDIINL